MSLQDEFTSTSREEETRLSTLYCRKNLDRELLLSMQRDLRQCHSKIKITNRRHLKKVLVLLKFRFSRLGATLQDVLQIGSQHFDNMVNAVLPDQFAYDVFKPLLDPLLEERHFGFNTVQTQPPITWGDWTTIHNLDPENKYIQWLSISVSRNLDGYRFTPNATPKDLVETSDLIVNALKDLPETYSGTYIPLRNMTPDEKSFLEEDRFMFELPPEDADDQPRFWPVGRGVFVDDHHELAVWVNARDHMCVLSQEWCGDFQRAYSRIVEVMEILDVSLKTARHERLGHLTVGLDNIGTGLLISVELKLPGVSKRMINRIANMHKWEVRIFENDTYFIRARGVLGTTEYDTAERFHRFIHVLLSLVEKYNTEIYDKEEGSDREAYKRKKRKNVVKCVNDFVSMYDSIPKLRTTELIKKASWQHVSSLKETSSKIRSSTTSNISDGTERVKRKRKMGIMDLSEL